MYLAEVAPDRAGGVDRDGEIDRAGRVALVDVAPDRARGMNCDGEVVVLDPEGAEAEEEPSLVFERLRGGSFGTEDGGSGTP